MNQPTIKESKIDIRFSIWNTILLSLFVLTILYPLIYVVSASFSNYDAIISGKVWVWPVEPTLEGYKAVFEYKMIWTGFRNSLYYTVAGTLINVAMTLLAAYPLSRKDLDGRNVLMFLFVFTTMFSGGLIPNYLLIQKIGILNTPWAILLPGAINMWNMIVTRTYFQTSIPGELLEAAKIDGCSDYRFLWGIVLPLSRPIIAVIALFYAVGHWNQYFNALIYLKEQSLYPLQIVLRDILVQNEVDVSMLMDTEDAARREGLRELLKYSLIVVSTLPMMAVYPFVQKHFVKGVMIGSLKG